VTSLRLALAQIDLVVGDLAANAAAVVARSHEAAAAGADLVCFPEMTLTGYPPEDLVFRRSFRLASRETLHTLATTLAAEGLGDLGVVVGYLDGHEHDDRGILSNDTGPRARNCAAFVTGGEVVAVYDKHHLPTYGVFDEARYFRPGSELPVVRFHGVDVAMTICEDAWQQGRPFAAARAARAGLVVNING
jgi:NAD+ synthase (glutamine-hydrolysing)